MPRGQQKVRLTRADLPEVSKLSNGEYGYVVRYRIISEDQNRFSHWSPIREISGIDVTAVEGSLVLSESSIQAVWGDDNIGRKYDVFVKFNDGEYFYHGTTSTHQYSFLFTEGDTSAQVAVQIASTNKERAVGLEIFESDVLDVSGLILSPVEVLGSMAVTNNLGQIFWGDDNQSPQYDIFINEEFDVLEASLTSNKATITITGSHSLSVGDTVEVSGDVTTERVIDDSFAPPAMTSTSIRSAIRLDNGQMIIAGSIDAIDGETRTDIARLNADGSLDTDFNPVITGSYLTTALIQTDGKILIGGNFNAVGGVTRNHIARLNSDGSLDTDFDPNAGSWVNSIALQSDDKIIIAGSFTTIDGTARAGIARLNSDGTLDTSFEVVLDTDSSFASIQPDGKVLVCGFGGGADDAHVFRVNSDGSKDVTFTHPVVDNTVRKVYPQSSGKVLIVGNFSDVDGSSRETIARLNSDGTLDTGFTPPFPDGDVRSALELSDGSILIGGLFTDLDGTSRNRIAKLASDGTLDADYDPDANGNVRFFQEQPNGDVIFSGGFNEVGGVEQNYVAIEIFDPSILNGIHEITEVPSSSSFSYDLVGDDIAASSSEATASGYFYVGSTPTHQFLTAVDPYAVSVTGKVQVGGEQVELSESLTIFESEPVNLV